MKEKEIVNYLKDHGFSCEDEYGVTINYGVVISKESDGVEEVIEMFKPYIDLDREEATEELIEMINKYTPYEYSYVDNCDGISIWLELKEKCIKMNADAFAQEIIDNNEDSYMGDDEMDELTWSVEEHSDNEYEQAIIVSLHEMGWQYTGRHYFHWKWHYHFQKAA